MVADTAQQALERKQARDERVVETMIGLYCRGNHHAPREGDGLCPDCCELAAYCRTRLERCPVAATKTFCSSCPVHCYTPAMRERIRAVMRYAGPRMLLHHPILAIQHALDGRGA